MQHQPGADYVQHLCNPKPDHRKGEKNPWGQHCNQEGPECSDSKMKILVIEAQTDTDQHEHLPEFHALFSADSFKYFSRPMHTINFEVAVAAPWLLYSPDSSSVRFHYISLPRLYSPSAYIFPRFHSLYLFVWSLSFPAQ